MTTIENENESEAPARRVRVTYEPVPGSKPWRAVIVGAFVNPPLSSEIEWRETQPVGRFDSAAEANTTGVSALRFVNAGIPWRPVGDQ